MYLKKAPITNPNAKRAVQEMCRILGTDEISITYIPKVKTFTLTRDESEIVVDSLGLGGKSMHHGQPGTGKTMTMDMFKAFKGKAPRPPRIGLKREEVTHGLKDSTGDKWPCGICSKPAMHHIRRKGSSEINLCTKHFTMLFRLPRNRMKPKPKVTLEYLKAEFKKLEKKIDKARKDGQDVSEEKYLRLNALRADIKAMESKVFDEWAERRITIARDTDPPYVFTGRKIASASVIPEDKKENPLCRGSFEHYLSLYRVGKGPDYIFTSTVITSKNNVSRYTEKFEAPTMKTILPTIISNFLEELYISQRGSDYYRKIQNAIQELYRQLGVVEELKA
jgi:hypothetical protein